MTQGLISIITPIYNTVEYLPKCIDSILSQTYKHWELLLIDDGSSDNSGLIALEYTKQDPRIRLLQLPENNGQAMARNWGLREIKGEFVAFVDSDDYIEPNMYQDMLKSIQQTSAQICICDTLKENKLESKITQELGMRYDPSKTLKENIFMADSPFMLPNKLFRRELFIKHDITFPQGLIWEDTSVCAILLGYAEKISYLSQSLYHIHERENSTTRQIEKSPAKIKRYLYDYIANIQLIRQKQKLYNLNEWQALTYRFLIHLRTLEKDMHNHTRGFLRYRLYFALFRELKRLYPYAPTEILRELRSMTRRLLFYKTKFQLYAYVITCAYHFLLQ